VEEMQDIIQGSLIEKGFKDVAKSFKEVREERNEVRQKKSQLIKDIGEKLKGEHVVNQNANVDERSFGGRIGEAVSVVCKNDALTNVMSRKSRKNHEGNMIYIHDLDSYSVGSHNCLTIPMAKLLAEGFKTRQCDIRPAGSVNTASQLVAVAFQIQSLQQFGGIAAGSIDWTMVPYIRKSFRKAYISRYIEDLDEFYDLDIMGMTDNELTDWLVKKVADFYIKYPNLKDDEVWKFDNKKILDKKLYQQALFETRKETYQAVEGLIHNLNQFGRHNSNVMNIAV
jgi:ribonucleoside-triphosphate reductase